MAIVGIRVIGIANSWQAAGIQSVQGLALGVGVAGQLIRQPAQQAVQPARRRGTAPRVVTRGGNRDLPCGVPPCFGITVTGGDVVIARRLSLGPHGSPQAASLRP